MFDARLLSVFREVATRGSFSDAAVASRSRSPRSPSRSRASSASSARGCWRATRGVTLTPAARCSCATPRRSAQLREAEAEVLRHRRGARVRVGAFERRREHHAAGAELRASHPEADVAMRVVEDAEALDALRRGELDVAMVLDSELMPLELPAGLAAVPVLDDPLLIALPYSHRLAGRSSISLADLRDEEWMVCGVGGTCIDSNVVLRACDAAGFEPRITFVCVRRQRHEWGWWPPAWGGADPSLALVSAREDIAIRPLRDARPVRRVRAAVAVDRPARWPMRCWTSCVRPGASARGRAAARGRCA
jgi:DNA-binding transcriptional LysR family regulator